MIGNKKLSILKQMDQETAHYIRVYFSKLMTEDEVAALKYHMYTYKTEDNPKMRKIMLERAWFTEDPRNKELLKDGYDTFEIAVAERIMKDSPEKVVLNTCPKCSKLARTPFAKQCRYCGCSWRD
jgi:flagellar motor switch protein FliG